MQTTLHHMMLPQGVPEWVHLVPSGAFKGVDGRGPYRLADAKAVVQASMAGGKLLIDQDHATDKGSALGLAAPARGWIVELDARSDGIWGKVEWTATGQALMAEGAYRGISPVYTHLEDGTVTQLLRASLTNIPNLSQLHTLHHQENGMDLADIRVALGLPETADGPAVLAAAEGMRAQIAAHAAQIDALAAAAGLPAGSAPEKVLVAVQSQGGMVTQVAAMAATITGLETKVGLMSAENAKTAATAFVNAAIAAGKPIMALKDHYIAQHAIDPARVEKEIGALVSINAGGMGGGGGNPTASGNSDTDLTDADKAVIAKMALDPAEFLKTKQKRAKPSDGKAA